MSAKYWHFHNSILTLRAERVLISFAKRIIEDIIMRVFMSDAGPAVHQQQLSQEISWLIIGQEWHIG